MNQQLVAATAFLGGIFLAIQAGFNAHLGVIIRKPLLASMSTSISSALFAALFVLLFSKELPGISMVRQVPWYLWFIGGLFSMMGITLYLYSIPKLGISRMISLGLCGQLIFSLIATHFGWLNLPMEPITWKKLMGAVAMIVGIIFINSK